jgi:hypothetical protein
MRGIHILIALIPAAMNAQQPAQPPKAEACSIEGQVVSTATGEPLPKASIQLMQIGKPRGEWYTTTATAGGRFALQDIEPGKYRLQATKTGYAQLQFGVGGASRQVTSLSLDSGQHLRDVVLRLVPQAVITGRVVDEDGEPMPHVSVEVLRYRYMAGKRQLLPSSGGMGTNDLGEYRVFGLAAGRYYLAARPQTDMDTPYQSGGWQSYARTYYPGTSDPAGATALDVSPGARLRGLDFTLMKTRSVRVRGHLVRAGGRPIQNQEVRLLPRDESFSLSEWWSFADPQGVFQFRGVTPGAYSVLAEWSEDGKWYSARQPVDVRENDISNLVVEFSPGAELKGQVRVEGRPLASFGDIHVGLQSDAAFRFGGGAFGAVKRDGSFTLSNIGPDRYRLNAFGSPEDYYIKSALVGDKEALDSLLDFTQGASGTLDILLSSNGGQVEGVVLNAAEQPVTGAAVVLVPDEPRRAQTRLYKDVSTDQYGRFNIKGIAPGGYKLFAWEEVESGAYQDPDFLKAFEALGERKAIREGSRESAQLKLIPAENKKPAPANPAR